MLDLYTLPQLEMLMEEHGGLTKEEALRQFEAVHYACAALFGGEGAKQATEYKKSLLPESIQKPKTTGPKSPHRRR